MTWKSLVLTLAAAGALAGCGAAREVAAADGALECAGCHGDDGGSGDPIARAAPVDAAHDAHVRRNAVACGTCHVVPATLAHMDGSAAVVFGAAARARGAQPSYADGTCSGVYCHGGAASSASWSGGALACGGCHQAPPASHDAAATGCSGCHAGTVKADGTIDLAGGLHANGRVDGPTGGAAHEAGWSDPARHGPAAKTDLASCQGCHGVTFAGGTSGVSCNACHGGTAWSSNCTFCHGTKVATYAQADLAKAAPPRGASGETAVADRAVGAHQRHLAGGAIGKAVACGECHAVPADLAHLDGSAAVKFGAAASRGTSPVWNGTTCASTYCHGATLKGGTNQAPTWTGGSPQATCGTCHGVPPPAPHSTSTACGGCHAGYTATTVNATLHQNGTLDRSTATHPAGWGAGSQHGYAVNRTGLADCKSCHGATLAGGSGPSCASCHAGGAAWATSCTFCHGTGTQAAPPVDTQGRTATTNVSVGLHGAHLGSALMNAPGCAECHPARTASVVTDAAHVDGDGVAEVAFGTVAKTGGAPATYTRASATSASCGSTYCHGRFTGGVSSGQGATMSWTSSAQVGCGSCHAASPSTGRHTKHVADKGYGCGECHGSGYTASAVVKATHVDGRKQVGNRMTSYTASSRTCTNSCHGNKGTW